MEESRKALLDQLERSGIPAAAEYTARLNRILAEFCRNPHQMAVEIEALRRGR
jgi:hypothetical protein